MTYEEYKNNRYLHIPSNKIYRLNGANGIIRDDNSTNVSLPFWLVENSKDWILIK